MRVVKKLTAVLLAVITAFTVSIIGFAEETEEKIEVRIKDSDFGLNLCIYSELRLAAYETVNVYQRDEDGNKTLLESLNVFENCYVCLYTADRYVAIQFHSKNPFVDQGSYTVEFIAKEVPPEGVEKHENLIIDFDYSDSIEPEFNYIEFSKTLELGRSLNLYSIYLPPEGYMGELIFRYVNDYEPDDYPVDIDETFACSLDTVKTGKAEVYIFDKESYEVLAKVKIRVIDEEPNNFFDLIKRTFKEMGNGVVNTFKNIGVSIASGIFGISFPIVAILSVIGALIFI